MHCHRNSGRRCRECARSGRALGKSVVDRIASMLSRQRPDVAYPPPHPIRGMADVASIDRHGPGKAATKAGYFSHAFAGPTREGFSGSVSV